MALSLVLSVVASTAMVVLAEERLVRFGFDVERWRHGLEHRQVVVDGETWHYLEGGPEDAPPVLLLHGFGADKDTWMRFAAPLVGAYRVIAPDLPGFGDSPRHGDWDYRLPAQRERLARFVEVLRVGRFHLAGNSMGGHLAALYALARREQVRTLGLFDSAGVVEPSPSEQTLMLRRGENPLRIESRTDYDRMLAFVTDTEPFVPSPARRLLADRAIADRVLHERILRSLLSDDAAPLDDVLGTLDTPTLVLWGAHDRAVDVSAAHVFHALLPNSRLVVMEDTGHVPMVERPEETAAIYSEFLSTHSEARSHAAR